MLLKYLLSYSLTAVVFFIIDILWIGVFASGFYKKQIGHLMADQVNWPAALIFYALFIAGIIFFAVEPAVERSSYWHALFLGAFLGLLTYSTYDLTNLATLKDWPIKMVVVDIIWGVCLTGMVATAGYFIQRWVH